MGSDRRGGSLPTNSISRGVLRERKWGSDRRGGSLPTNSNSRGVLRERKWGSDGIGGSLPTNSNSRGGLRERRWSRSTTTSEQCSALLAHVRVEVVVVVRVVLLAVCRHNVLVSAQGYDRRHRAFDASVAVAVHERLRRKGLACPFLGVAAARPTSALRPAALLPRRPLFRLAAALLPHSPCTTPGSCPPPSVSCSGARSQSGSRRCARPPCPTE